MKLDAQGFFSALSVLFTQKGLLYINYLVISCCFVPFNKPLTSSLSKKTSVFVVFFPGNLPEISKFQPNFRSHKNWVETKTKPSLFKTVSFNHQPKKKHDSCVPQKIPCHPSTPKTPPSKPGVFNPPDLSVSANASRQMLHNCLNSCLDRLVGPRCLELKAPQKGQVRWVGTGVD